MSVDLAAVGLALDTTQVEKGDQVTARAFEHIGANAERATARVAQFGPVTADVARQNEKLLASAERMRQIQQQASATASAYTAGLQRDFARMQADTREASARGLITPAEAYKRGQEAAQSYNRGLLAQMDRLGGAGAFSGNQGQALFVGLAGQIKDVDVAATNAGRGGLRTLSSQLAQMAASEVGARAGLGSLASTVSFFALGSLTSVGVIAGLAAIAFAITKVKEEAEAAEKPMKDLLDRAAELRTARQEKEGLQLGIDFATARQAAIELQPEIERLREKVQQYFDELARHGGGDAFAQAVGAGLRTQLGALEQRRSNAERAAEEFRLEIERRKSEGQDRENEKARRNHEARLSELAALAAVERNLALLRAGNASEELAAQRAIRAAEIDAQVKEATHLTTTERAKLRTVLEQTDARREHLRTQNEINEALEREIAALNAADPIYQALLERETKRLALFKEYQLVLGRIQLDPRGFAASIQQPVIGLSGNQGPYDPNAAARNRAIENAAKLAEQRYDAALRTVTDAFQRSFSDLLKSGSVRGFFDGIVDLAQQSAASIAAAFSVRALGIDDLLKKITSGAALSGREKVLVGGGLGVAIGSATGNPLLGSLGGAATALAAGTGPLGAIAGAVGGFVSGLFSSGAKAREAALKFAEARRSWERTLSDLTAIAHPRGPLGSALENLTRQFQDAQQAAIEAAGGDAKARQQILGAGDVTKLSQSQIQAALDAKNLEIAMGGSGRAARDYLVELLRLRKIFDEASEATRQLILEQKQRTTEDLRVRELRASGLTDEAEAMAFALQQQRERLELEKAMGQELDQVLLDQLKMVQGQELEARARDRLREAQEKTHQALLTELSLREREANLSGDTAAALAANRDRQLAELGKSVVAGDIPSDLFERFFAVIVGEYNKALREQEDAARATAKALDDLNASMQLDTELRILQAQATISGADADRRRMEDARRIAEQQKEIDDAVANGATDATLAAIKLAQSWEDQALAATRAAEETGKLVQAQEESARLAREQAQATEDLNVRLLRAQGLTDQANDAAREAGQAQEVVEAITKGFGPVFLDLLKIVHDAEDAQAFADRATEVKKAIDDVTGETAREGRGDFASVRSITAAQADTMTAYLASIAANTSQLVRLAGGTPSQANRGVVGGLSAGGGVPAPVVNVSVSLDGQAIAASTDARLGRDGDLAGAARGTPSSI